ncbi:ATP-binding protein [Embleya sp. NPDC059259]|uniref:ATP-binding protein n=1 Tax=unclassified Embleya TaxID=2699296 RepID=UPI0036AFC17A
MKSSPTPHLDLLRDTVVTAIARAHVVAVCATLGIDRFTKAHADWLDDVLVVVCELVTNALKHTTGAMAVHWWSDEHVVTFAVTDTRFVQLVWARENDAVPADEESGRGLGIVATLADRLEYGPIHEGAGGKWVAASFTLPNVPFRTRRKAMGKQPSWHSRRAPGPGDPLDGPDPTDSRPDSFRTTPAETVRSQRRSRGTRNLRGFREDVLRCRSEPAARLHRLPAVHRR